MITTVVAIRPQKPQQSTISYRPVSTGVLCFNRHNTVCSRTVCCIEHNPYSEGHLAPQHTYYAQATARGCSASLVACCQLEVDLTVYFSMPHRLVYWAVLLRFDRRFISLCPLTVYLQITYAPFGRHIWQRAASLNSAANSMRPPPPQEGCLQA